MSHFLFVRLCAIIAHWRKRQRAWRPTARQKTTSFAPKKALCKLCLHNAPLKLCASTSLQHIIALCKIAVARLPQHRPCIAVLYVVNCISFFDLIRLLFFTRLTFFGSFLLSPAPLISCRGGASLV